MGRVTFRLVPRAHGRIGVDADPHEAGDDLADLVRHCRRDGWLRIWFDSGHTYADGGVFRVRFRDYPFAGIRFADFAGYDVTKEKPTHPFLQEEIGRHDSLFCWALHHWPVDGNPGWLVCDDGAMEVADFIHLDGDLLTLIHAKGATNNDQLRNLSVASYEVVASQVTKCLRWRDEAHLTGNLTAGIQHKVGAAVWHNRHRSNRAEFLRAIRTLGTHYRRRVVILQPQITNRNLANSGADQGAEHTRYQQLMTLLNGTRTACQSQGAELLVIGQQVAEQATRRARRARP